MSVDAQRIGLQVAGIHAAYSAPLDLVVATFFLIQLLGESKNLEGEEVWNQ